MQGTQVQSLVQEDPTCSGATKPVTIVVSLWAETTEAGMPQWALQQGKPPPAPQPPQLEEVCAATKTQTKPNINK